MHSLHVVTGAAGHLGSAVVRVLLDAGQNVRALVLPGDPAASRLPASVEQVTGNVLDPTSLRRLLKADSTTAVTVYHCAGLISTSMRDNPTLRTVNVEGTRQVIAACREAGVRKLVHVSSVHALPETPQDGAIREARSCDPAQVIGPYAKSKAEATQLVFQAAAAGLDASVVFPSGICGPGDPGQGHMTRLLMAYAARRLRMGVQGGFDFVDVRDVAQGMCQCAETGKPGEGYILSNRYVSVSELFALFSRFTGIRPVRLYPPSWLAAMGIPAMSLLEVLAPAPRLFSRYALHSLSGHFLYAREKAMQAFGYRVRPFEDTVRDTVAWLRAEHRLA